MAAKRLASLAALARSGDPLADRDTLLQRLKIERPESRHLEWRQTLPVVPSATLRTNYRTVRSILAFANTGGGFLVFGVDPQGNWKGLSRGDLENFDPASLEELLRSCVAPAIPNIQCAEAELSGAWLMVVHVPPSSIVPHVTTKEVFEDVVGSRRGAVLLARAAVYCRHGAKSDLATVDDYERIVATRTELLRQELLRRVKEVEVPVSNPASTKIYRLSSEATATPVRFTRRDDEAAGVLVREELAEGIFDEVNNILTANSLLASGRKQFSFGTEIYYRIYAERQKVDGGGDQMELLARTALRLYGPTLYWLLMIPPHTAGRLLRDLYEDPKSPQVHSLLRIVILLGPDVSGWLHGKWEATLGKQSQPPDFYWALRRMVRRTGVHDRRLQALRTTSAGRLEDGTTGLPVKELLKAPAAAATKLTDLCRQVSLGHKRLRSTCRDLDVIAYGEEIVTRGDEIGKVLMGPA